MTEDAFSNTFSIGVVALVAGPPEIGPPEIGREVWRLVVAGGGDRGPRGGRGRTSAYGEGVAGGEKGWARQGQGEAGAWCEETGLGEAGAGHTEMGLGEAGIAHTPRLLIKINTFISCVNGKKTVILQNQ